MNKEEEMSYKEALENKVKDYKKPYNRLLIFFAELNRNLLPEKQLSDTEIELIASKLEALFLNMIM